MKTWVKIAIGTSIILVVAGFLGWRLLAGRLEEEVKTASVTYQDVTKDITFTGKTEAAQSADLAFELSGSINHINVRVGDSVTKGQQLLSLDPQSVTLQLAKARADRASASSVEYLSWQKAASDAKNTAAENSRVLEQRRQAVRDAKAALDQSKEVFQQKAVEAGDESSATLSAESAIVANEGAYHSAQTALETALKSAQKLNSAANNSADIAYAQYIATQQASIHQTGLSSLEALEELARANTQKSILRAPFDGIVTNTTSEVGEFTAAGAPVITIATTGLLQTSADVPETDALALTPAMTASVTFDALPTTKEIQAKIQQIYPVAKTIEGVPTFHVVLVPGKQDSDLRAGITANITVHADKREHVLAIPRRSVISKSDKQFVRIQTSEKVFTEVEVTTGLVGSDGLIEIVSGLKEGDIVVTP